MATRISDARDRRRASGQAVERAAYAGQGAGLYSEVTLSRLPLPISPVGKPLADDDLAGSRALT
jgi:hypothetical protein